MMTKAKIIARARHRFSASPARVFDAWLDPQKVRVWMRMALTDFGLSGEVRRVEIDPHVGGTFAFSDMRKEGEAVHWGTYLVIDRPRKLVFTWFTSQKEEEAGLSTVTLIIEPDGEGCIATIAHEMDAEHADYAEQVERGWGTMLTQIGVFLSSRGGSATAQERRGMAIEPRAKAEMLIRKPVAEVFEAFVDPEITSKFWFTGGNGRLEPGKTVTWEWAMYNFSIPVEVKAIAKGRRILIAWPGQGGQTSVEWAFTDRRDGTTYVTIANWGFAGDDEQRVSEALNATEGFTYVLAGAKAYLEHGIRLNLVQDKFPDGLPAG